jgi:hypothetical protein
MLLNSILVEGTVLSAVSFTPATATSPDRVSFFIDCGPSAPSIPILVQDRLALRCRALSPGTLVRLVGRLHHDAEASTQSSRFSLVVLVEHVELVPAIHHKEVA